MDDLDFLDSEMDQPSVFIDEGRLSPEYVPKNLLFRTENLKALARHHRSLFTDSQTASKMIITGSVGTGKTSIAKKFGYWAEKKGKESKIPIEYVHINCRRNRTPFMILLAIARSLSSHIPGRGYSSDELMEMIVDILEARGITMLLVLDEIDYALARGSSDLLYALTRSGDEKQDAKHRIVLTLICQSTSFLSHLDISTKSSLAASIMKLEPYTKKQLVGILEDRIKQSFIPGSVTNDAILLSADISSGKGDARQALELMWFAGKFADKENSTMVYPEHIRLAKANIEPSILRQVINEITTHRLLLLLGIARQLRYSKAAFITTGTTEEAYQIICEEYSLTARKHTQIWEYLKELESIGILVTRKSSYGQRGNTQLISIQDVSANELEQEVLKRLHELFQTTTVTL
jgi:cell division control protein 6